MEFREYPKALYLAGVMLLVADAAAETVAREDGYDDWHFDHARTEGALAPAADEQPMDRDALKAEASKLDLHFAPNIKTDKLAALVGSMKNQTE